MQSKLKELKKISWVKPKDLCINSLMVLIFTTIMTLLIYGEDLIIPSLMSIINNLF